MAYDLGDSSGMGLADIMARMRARKDAERQQAPVQQNQQQRRLSQRLQELRMQGMTQEQAINQLRSEGGINPRLADLMQRFPREAGGYFGGR